SLRQLGFALELPEADVARLLRFGFFVDPRAADQGFVLDADLRGGERHGPAGARDSFTRCSAGPPPGSVAGRSVVHAASPSGSCTPPASAASVALPAVAAWVGPPASVVSLRQAILDADGRMTSAEEAVGLSLSGGLDSSCIAVAAGLTTDPLPAYRMRAAGSNGEERGRARMV